MRVLRWFGRTIGRFIFGIVWLFISIALMILIIAYCLVVIVDGACLMWALACGFFYLVSHRPDMEQAFWTFLLIGTVGFGIIVVIQWTVWDVISGARTRLAPKEPALELEFSEPFKEQSRPVWRDLRQV
ncbi:MAG: hypothetical protein ABSC06_23525 [Rhodopila sp.]|jgi:hypothetical protein